MKTKNARVSLPTLLIYLVWWVGLSNGFVVSRRAWLGRVDSLIFRDGEGTSHSFAQAADSNESSDKKRRLPRVIIFGRYAVYLVSLAIEQ